MKDNLPRDGYEVARAAVPERIRRDMKTSDDFREYMTRGVSRRSVLKGIGIAGAAAAAAGPILWKRPGFAAEPPRGVHINYGTDPMREMGVAWFTSSRAGKPVVEFGTDTSYGSIVDAVATTYKADDASQAQDISTLHQATIPGLEPGKTYHYRVRHQGGESEDFSFTTAPDEIKPFRFTSFGDHGSDPGSNASRASWGTPASPLAVQAIEKLDPAFHVHNGDISYSCGGPQQAWDVWSEEVQPRASKMPWMVTMGNHEMELGFGPQGYDPFRSRFRLPDNGIDWTPDRTSTFYSFRYSNVLVLMLDGNEAASEYGYHFNRGYMKGKQDAWIDATLKAGRADPTIDWILCSFHNCMYCTDAIHGSDGGIRVRWQALFEKHRVDVVLNGHNHCYERTHPILGGSHTTLTPGQSVDPNAMGVTYLCAGGGGQLAAPRSASTFPVSMVSNPDATGGSNPEPADWRASRVEGYSIAVFDVDPGTPGGKTTLTLSTKEFVSAAMGEVDKIVLERPAKAIAAPRRTSSGGSGAPKPRPTVQGAKHTRDLPATGVGDGLVVGALAIGTAAALRGALNRERDAS